MQSALKTKIVQYIIRMIPHYLPNNTFSLILELFLSHCFPIKHVHLA